MYQIYESVSLPFRIDFPVKSIYIMVMIFTSLSIYFNRTLQTVFKLFPQFFSI